MNKQPNQQGKHAKQENQAKDKDHDKQGKKRNQDQQAISWAKKTN